MSTQIDSPVYLQVIENVAIIKLNRPSLLNSIDDHLAKSLIDTLDHVDNNSEIKTVLLTGEGRAFCAGQDLAEATSISSDENELCLGDIVKNRYNVLINKISSLNKPTIACVNGVAAGAGLGLALACDIRMITPKTKFSTAFIKIGLAPDSGCSYFLSRLVGLSRALELTLTGRVVSGEEALQIGLATTLIETEDELYPESLKLAQQLAKGPSEAIRLTKESIYYGFSNNLSDSLDFEAECQKTAGKTYDFKEGMEAFLQKRAPSFSGK